MMTNLGSKPHNLSKQNELIQRMMAGTANQGSGKPITSKDPLLSTGEMKEHLGGTPKMPRKSTGPIQRRGNSQSRVIERAMELP